MRLFFSYLPLPQVIRIGMGCGEEMDIGYNVMGDEVLLNDIIEDGSGQLIFDIESMGK